MTEVEQTSHDRFRRVGIGGGSEGDGAPVRRTAADEREGKVLPQQFVEILGSAVAA